MTEPRYRFLGAYDAGGDVLEVRYQLAGEPAYRVARGWVSATTEHYDADAYGEDGHRKADAQARAMTPAELRSYAESVIDAQLAAPAPAEPAELVAPDPAPVEPPAPEPPAPPAEPPAPEPTPNGAPAGQPPAAPGSEPAAPAAPEPSPQGVGVPPGETPANPENRTPQGVGVPPGEEAPAEEAPAEPPAEAPTHIESLVDGKLVRTPIEQAGAGETAEPGVE